MWSSRKAEIAKAVLAGSAVFSALSIAWFGAQYLDKGGQDCVRVNDDDFAARMPAVNAAFNLMAQLPVTGKPVLDALHKTNVEICNDPARPTPGGTYDNNSFTYKLTPEDAHFLPTVVVHESFHHLQVQQSGMLANALKVNTPQFMYANMLAEAGASAYQLMAGAEARKIDPSLWNAAAERWPEASYTFKAAYEKAKDAQMTDAQALEKGGQAVVTQMVSGMDRTFSLSYIVAMQVNGRRHIHASAAQSRNPMISGSEEVLSQMFNGMTRLGSIDISPAQPGNENNAARADRAVKNFGYSFTGV